MKICEKCGTTLDNDAMFCVSCGAHLNERETTETKAVENKTYNVDSDPVSKTIETPCVPVSTMSANSGNDANKSSPITKIIGLIVGSILIIVGLIRVLSAGTTISPTSFGGDFYTYTYKGIVAISEILASIEVSLGWVIVAIGAVIDVNALRK